MKNGTKKSKERDAETKKCKVEIEMVRKRKEQKGVWNKEIKRHNGKKQDEMFWGTVRELFMSIG